MKHAGSSEFSNWEAVLAEVIVGDAFGADRMDYLLRDAHYAGVPYGIFDHYRLVDTLRILPRPDSKEPTLGVEEGGLRSAEALLLARYFMYSQVYCHGVRRIYDIHLQDFLRSWLPRHTFPTELDEFFRYTDNEVTAALREAANDESKPGHEDAKRIIERKHFKVLYSRNENDIKKNPEAVVLVFNAAKKKFGARSVRHDNYNKEGGSLDFPVLRGDDRVVSSLSESETLRHLPVVVAENVFIDPAKKDGAAKWLAAKRESIISSRRKGE